MPSLDDVDDIVDATDIDNGVITERDNRIDHDNFNLVDNSHIARVETVRMLRHQ